MTNWLVRRFITNWQNPDEADVRSQYGHLSGMVGIVVNAILFVAKLAAGLLTGSISITGDAFNNLSDTASSVIAIVSFRMSKKPADREHPFGHARFEYFASTIVAVLILLVAADLIRSSVNKIIRPEEIQFSWTALIVLMASILIKWWLYSFNRHLATAIASPLLRATAIDSLSDVLATAIVLAGAVLSPLIGFSLDGFLGIVVALIIARSAVDILRDTADSILGAAPDEEETMFIEVFVESYDGILGTHDLMIHSYGPGRSFASIHAEMDAGGSVIGTHEVIDRIERDMLQQHGVDLLIHLDPVILNDPELDRVRDELDRLIRTIDPQLSQHDLHVRGRGENRQLLFDVSAPYDLQLSDEALISRIGALVRASQMGSGCLITIDRTSEGNPL